MRSGPFTLPTLFECFASYDTSVTPVMYGFRPAKGWWQFPLAYERDVLPTFGSDEIDEHIPESFDSERLLGFLRDAMAGPPRASVGPAVIAGLVEELKPIAQKLADEESFARPS